MSNLHRIKWIDEQIRNNIYPNCSDIAGRFEISARQASRDIEYMRYSLGAPIEYSPENNGYHYTDSAFELPAIFITNEEKEALSYLAYKYMSSGTDQALKLAGLFSRLTGDGLVSKGEPAGIPVLGVRGPEAAFFIRLKKAVNELEKVEIEYISAKNEFTRRVFCPYKFFTVAHTTYIVGFCELRQETRVFQLPRIRGVKGTGMHFEVPASFRPGDYVDDSAFNRKDPYTAKVRFAKPPDMGACKVDIISANDSVYELSFHDSGEMLSMLLSQRSDFTVVSPKWLREKLLKKTDSILKNNS